MKPGFRSIGADNLLALDSNLISVFKMVRRSDKFPNSGCSYHEEKYVTCITSTFKGHAQVSVGVFELL